MTLPGELGAGVAGAEAVEGEFCSSRMPETEADAPPLSPGPAPVEGIPVSLQVRAPSQRGPSSAWSLE